MQRGFRVGEWDVLPLEGEIRRAGDTVHLEPKVMEVLVTLAEQAESVVLREELLDRVWGPRAAVSDEPLTRCIAQLRQAFGDSAREPAFIQTVPKRGYRLMQPALPPGSGSPAPEPPEPPGLAPAQPAAPRRWHSLAAIGTAGIVLLVVIVLVQGGLPGFGAGSDPRCEIDRSERAVGDRARRQCELGLIDLDDRTALSLENAMEHLRAALRAEPDYGAAYVNLARAWVLYPTYRRDVAARDCTLDPDDADGAVPDDCFDAAFELLRLNQHRAPYIAKFTWGINGYVHTKRHEWQAARGAFEEAVRVWPDDADMWQWLSQFEAAVGNREAALAAAIEAERLAPGVPAIAFRHVVALLWLDRTEEAARRYDDARDRFVGHHPYRDLEVVINLRLGRMDEVRRLLTDADDGRPEDTAWVEPFLRAFADDTAVPAAKVAVTAALASGSLTGQLGYGALTYLGEAGAAIAAARELLASAPLRLDVEFLFSAEAVGLRDHPDFDLLIADLGLDAYWSFDGYCPLHFTPDQQSRWCGVGGGSVPLA